jgi:hypothetical protein
MLHGRFSGIGQPVNWVVVDILRIENGLLGRHPGRGDKGSIRQWPAHVRRRVSRLTAAAKRTRNSRK